MQSIFYFLKKYSYKYYGDIKMKITAMYFYFLLIFLSSNAFAEKSEFIGVEAESVFTRFLENYKSKTKNKFN